MEPRDQSGKGETAGDAGRAGLPPVDESFRSLLEVAPDAMVVADARGHIVIVNRQTERLFGYPRGLLVTAAVRDISERRAADNRFRALLEAAPDAMVIVDRAGSIVLVNAQT